VSPLSPHFYKSIDTGGKTLLKSKRYEDTHETKKIICCPAIKAPAIKKWSGAFCHPSPVRRHAADDRRISGMNYGALPADDGNSTQDLPGEYREKAD
jgi:hypothetical protein